MRNVSLSYPGTSRHSFESARNMTLELCATRGIQDALRSGCLGQARPEEALARAYGLNSVKIEAVVPSPDSAEQSSVPQTGAQRSGSGLERRSGEVNGPSRRREGERYAARDDEGPSRP